MIPIAQTIQNKKINAGIIPILGLEILQNHSNKNSMSLAQIQACKQPFDFQHNFQKQTHCRTL
jgi:hypothetical protein